MSSILITALLLAAIPGQQHSEDGRGQGLFTREWHAERRAALRAVLSAWEEPGVVVLRGAGVKDDYRAFYQDNLFWYFTGVTSPDAVWVMVPATGEEWFLIPTVSARLRRWDGDVVDPEMARAITGIEQCLPLGNSDGPSGALLALLTELSVTHKTVFTDLQPAENWMMARDYAARAFAATQADPYDGRVSREQQFAARLAERHGVKVRDLSPVSDALRARKTPQEITALREACRIAGEGHALAMRTALPEDPEWRIAVAMRAEFQRLGAFGDAYAPIVGAGRNACVLHYKENRHPLARGQVVMIDYAPDYARYDADLSRSWPVDARFTPRQREVFEAVLAAQDAAFAECHPGSNLGLIHEAANAVLRERGFGPLVHSTSHWIGLGTHGVGPGKDAPLLPGMTFSVEPGIYLDDEELGVRVEDIVLITEDGYEVLSAGAPRTVAEIEALRREAWSRPEAERFSLIEKGGRRHAPIYSQLREDGPVPVLASAAVRAEAMEEARATLEGMLADRADLRRALRESGAYLIVMAADEFVHQIPEYAHMQPPLYWARRSRGFGAQPSNPATSVGEENLLRMRGDPMGSESILVHEFAHTLHHMALDRVDPGFSPRLQEAFAAAKAEGLWAGKYAATNSAEYWAEGVQSWFDCNRPPDHDHNEVNTREELVAHDPRLAALCAEVFAGAEWRWQEPAGRIPGWDPARAPAFRWSAEILADDANYQRRVAEEIAGR
ncbi:MAG: aminopeptidase P N-terminal domain-containing protein [Planctomycetota bacterium]|nr:aminopeptidase P N-terminal domain-containing protein [Planctomycetota bacterium]